MEQYENSAKGDRLKAEARDMCPVCEQTVWVSFYFDAFGHRQDTDGEHMSNIGKLFMAAMDKRDKGIARFYYPGLGANYEPEISELEEAQNALLEKAVKDELLKEAKAAETKAAAAAFKKSKAEIIADLKKNGMQGWRERAEKIVKANSKDAVKVYQNQYRIVFKPRERAKFLRGISRHWRNFFEDLATHPWRAIKIVETELAKITAGHVAERWNFVRDASFVAALFNTGVDTRLLAAEVDFKKFVALTKSCNVIKQINIAIFGADMGGALALAFANKLQKEICKGGKFMDASVNIRFIGLFDCVSNRYDDNFATGFVPLSNAIVGEQRLPKGVDHIVHFAAAHENRLYKQLTSIGGIAKPGSPVEEYLFPGAQEDVVGGYTSQEQGVSNQLSRMPLQMMLGRAWRNGVPVYSLEKMRADKSVKTAEIYSAFKMDESIRDLVYAYWQKVKTLSSTVVPASKYVDIHHLGQTYADTGNACVPLLKPADIVQAPANLQEEMKGHVALQIAWLKHWYTHYQPPAALTLRQEWLETHKRTALDQRYEFLSNEIHRLSEKAKINPLEPSALSDKERALWTAWDKNDPKILGDSLALFERYVHDSMEESMIESMFDHFFYSRHYIDYRTITTITFPPDQTFFDKMVDGAASAVKWAGEKTANAVKSVAGEKTANEVKTKSDEAAETLTKKVTLDKVKDVAKDSAKSMAKGALGVK